MTRRRHLRLLLVLPSFVALYLLAAVAGAMIGGAAPVRTAQPSIPVGLVAGPIHYDFILPATDEVRRRFAFAERAGVPVGDPGTQWLLVGWGAEAFYTTTGTYADVSFAATWRGLTGDRSVLRVEALGPVGGDQIAWLALTPTEFAALVGSMLGDLSEGAPVLPVPTRPGSGFFASPGRFDLLRTCNVWVGEKLRAAGLPFGRWTPTTYSVRLSLARFGLRTQSPGGPPGWPVANTAHETGGAR